MEQRDTTPKGHSGAALALPPWLHRATPQAATAQPSTRSRLAPGLAVLGDAYGYAILFGIIALLFQSHIPLYLGALVFLTDGARLPEIYPCYRAAVCFA